VEVAGYYYPLHARNSCSCWLKTAMPEEAGVFDAVVFDAVVLF
jgi:hypothetical protein